MDLQVWTLAALGLLAAGIIKGATGIGFATCALPVLTYFVDLKPAMVLILAPTFATNLSVAISGGHLAQSASKFAPLYLAMLPGVGVGVWLLSVADQAGSVFLLGILLISYSLYSLIKPDLSIDPVRGAWLRAPVGFVNGVVTGLTGSQVMPLVPYMLALDIDPKEAIHGINLGVLVLTIVLGTGLLATHVANRELLVLSVVAVAPAIAGSEIGNRLRARLSVQHVRRLVFIVVGFMGLRMILN